MRSIITTTTVTTSLLGVAVVLTFALPDSLSVPTISAGGTPDQVYLTGVLRDFPANHPDFGVLPAGGAGHYAGNVAFTLGSDGRPIFNTGSDGNGPFDSRVAHWTLDDGSGSTATDEMGLNDGALTNGPTWTTGRAGGALHFDGVNDYVEIPSSPQIQITGNITFTGWFKLDEDFDASSAATMVIMEKFLDTEHDFHVALAGLDYNRPQVPKGALVFKVENGADSDHYRYVWTNRTSWTAGTWYHFAAVLVSSDTSQNALLIDGVDDTDPVQAGGIGFIDTDYDAPMRIGGKTIDYNGFATDIYFKGTLDDIAIFDRALVPEDLAPSPGGYKVAAQWEDDATNPIAPHLYVGPGAGSSTGHLAVEGKLTGNVPGTVFDGYDSSAGPYGGGNAGFDITISTNSTTSNIIDLADVTVTGDVLCGPGGDPGTAIKLDNCTISGVVDALPSAVTMPVLSAPTDMGASIGDRNYIGGTHTLSTDLHCDKFNVDGGAILRIDGDVRILAEGEFKVSASELRVLPGGRLTVYTKVDFKLENAAKANANTADPSRLLVYHLQPGSDNIKVDGGSELHARIEGPGGELTVAASQFYGTFIGGSAKVQSAGGVHIDLAGYSPAPCGTLGDTAGSKGVDSDGGITGASTFAQWFRDVPGANLSVSHAIPLTRDGAGVYNYVNPAFYPLDNRLYGNEGESHNNYFTYAIHASFPYKECWQQFIEFQGGDGVWIFINDQLVVDLGGVDATDEQFVAVDRLGLTDGETYGVSIFYAQRQSTNSLFSLRTTLDLAQSDIPSTISAAFD